VNQAVSFCSILIQTAVVYFFVLVNMTNQSINHTFYLHLQDVAVGRATETVQHCKEYLVSAKDASLQQVRSVLKPKDATDAKDAAAVNQDVVPAEEKEEEEGRPCSIDQAVENIEKNTMVSFPFGGFPSEPEECEDDLISVSGGGGQVATA
jgi:hypothetical protein